MGYGMQNVQNMQNNPMMNNNQLPARNGQNGNINIDDFGNIIEEKIRKILNQNGQKEPGNYPMNLSRQPNIDSNSSGSTKVQNPLFHLAHGLNMKMNQIENSNGMQNMNQNPNGIPPLDRSGKKKNETLNSKYSNDIWSQ